MPLEPPAAEELPPLPARGVAGGGACDCATPCPLAHLPRDFFLDWSRVAGEEAKHYRKWMARLVAMGGRYGEFPGHVSFTAAALQASTCTANERVGRTMSRPLQC